ncbi:hypothetical protein ABT104_27495, partial [Streptomyces mobaraensis]|uniref:hypothetical protein n=1 Tax=Streptomyces mobaraensis TaxID=35621 RepID=UPI0033196515
RRIFALSGDLVDLVDVDDAPALAAWVSAPPTFPSRPLMPIGSPWWCGAPSPGRFGSARNCNGDLGWGGSYPW